MMRRLTRLYRRLIDDAWDLDIVGYLCAVVMAVLLLMVTGVLGPTLDWRDAYREEDPAKMKVLSRGKRLEPVVIAMLREDYGLDVAQTGWSAESAA